MEEITFSGGVDNFVAFMDKIINDSEWHPYAQEEGMCWGEVTVWPALKPAKPGRATWQVITFDALGSIAGMGTIEAYEVLPGQTSIVFADGIIHPPIGQPFSEFADWLAGQLLAPAEPTSSHTEDDLKDRLHEIKEKVESVDKYCEEKDLTINHFFQSHHRYKIEAKISRSGYYLHKKEIEAIENQLKI